MQLEELDIFDDSFEVSHSANGEVTYMPIMDEYPSPENQFDVFLHNDGQTSGGGNVDPNAIAGAVGAVAGLASTIAQNRDATKAELRTRCGRKPLFGKEKKKRYFECVDKFYGGGSGSFGGSKSMMPQETYFPPAPVEEERRGLSTGAIVGISLAVVALGVGGYFLYKKSKG